MFVPSPFANMDDRTLEALLRDDFAGKAMAVVMAEVVKRYVSGEAIGEGARTTEGIARAAYDLADDMIVERRRRFAVEDVRRSPA